jgi:hypothetical protein
MSPSKTLKHYAEHKDLTCLVLENYQTSASMASQQHHFDKQAYGVSGGVKGLFQKLKLYNTVNINLRQLLLIVLRHSL